MWRSSPSLSAIPARSDPKETLMRRRAKPVKASIKGKRPPARKSPTTEDARGHDLAKRLAEAMKGKAEALERETATSEILRRD